MDDPSTAGCEPQRSHGLRACLVALYQFYCFEQGDIIHTTTGSKTVWEKKIRSLDRRQRKKEKKKWKWKALLTFSEYHRNEMHGVRLSRLLGYGRFFIECKNDCRNAQARSVLSCELQPLQAFDSARLSHAGSRRMETGEFTAKDNVTRLPVEVEIKVRKLFSMVVGGSRSAPGLLPLIYS